MDDTANSAAPGVVKLAQSIHLKKIVNTIDKISKICGFIGAPLPFFCAILIVYEIVMRTILEMPTPWVAETTAMLCAACYFFGGAWNIKQDGHIRVDIIYTTLRPRVKAGVSCLNFFFFALYILFMIRVIYPYMVQSVQLNESTWTYWNPIIWPLKIVMFFGFCLVFVQGLACFFRDLYFFLTGHEL